MSEGSGALWKWVQRNLLPPDIQVTRIESECSAGFPDVHFNYYGVSGTIELKFLRKKRLPFGTQGLNKYQIAWHREANEQNAHSLIIADVNDEVYVISGRWFSHFNGATNLDHMSRLIVTKGRCSDEDRQLFSNLLRKIGI